MRICLKLQVIILGYLICNLSMKSCPNRKEEADGGNVGFVLYLDKFPNELSDKGIISMRYSVFVKKRLIHDMLDL